MLPTLWLALYGSRTQLRLGIAATAGTAEAWRTGSRIYIADVAADPRALGRLTKDAEAGALPSPRRHSV